MYHKGLMHFILFFISLKMLPQCMWIPSIWMWFTSRDKGWYVPHVRHGGSWLWCGCAHIWLSIAMPLLLQQQSLKWEDHSLSFPGEDPSPWPLCGTLRTPHEAVTSEGIAQLCTCCVCWVEISALGWGGNAALEMCVGSITWSKSWKGEENCKSSLCYTW